MVLLSAVWRFLTRLLGLSKPNKPEGIPRLFQLGGGWGNRIEFYRWPTGIVGWKGDPPREGDYVMGEMTSGEIGVWRVIDVNRMLDPADMFFADVMWLGYVGTDVSKEWLLTLGDPQARRSWA